MRKSLQNKSLGLAGLVASVALLMGACPMDEILNNVGQPPAGKAAAPTIQFTRPTARVDVQEGTVVNIQWTDMHPAGAVTVQLYYDRDGVGGTGDEQTITVLTESAATTGGTYAWNTTGMAPNVYRLAATINDQTNPVVTTYLPYELVIRANANTTPTGPLGLQVLQPTASLSRQGGESVIVSWKATGNLQGATLTLYYDPDLNPSNGNEVFITSMPLGNTQPGANDYGWNIPLDLSGSFNLLGRLHNGLEPDVFVYAPGVVTVGQITAASFVRDINDIGTAALPGTTFNGHVSYGHLGQVMTGGRDIDGDRCADFVLVAPKAISQVLAEYNDGTYGVGEAYLLYSRGPQNRWTKPVSIGGIGTPQLVGTRFVGSQYLNATSGISDVMFIDDVDRDTPSALPELVFGIGNIDGVIEDQQDYDPLDNNTIHGNTPPAPAGWTAGMYYFQCPGWQIFSNTPWNRLEDGITIPGRAPSEMRSGLVTWVSSKGVSGMRNGVVLMDEIGGEAVWFNRLPGISPCVGMKVFPVAGGDDSGWGTKLGTAVIFGDDDYPTVLVARPNHAGGAGSVKLMPHRQMIEVTNIWTAPPTGLTDFQVQPNCYTFPAADNTGGDDPDRNPEWPWWWNLFMDPLWMSAGYPRYPVLVPPSEYNFDIINNNLADAADGHMTNPTGLKDFDGDKTGDFAVATPDSLNQTGLAFVIYGNESFIGADVGKFATNSGTARGFELRGTQAGEQLGYKMAGPGNVTRQVGLRQSDWALTAPHRTVNGRVDCGALILVPGQSRLLGSYTLNQVVPDLGGAIIYGANDGDRLGMYMVAAGDVDHDGYQDILISAPGYGDLNAGRSKCGAVYLIYGGSHLTGEIDIRDIGTPTLPGKIYVGPEDNAAIGPISPAGDTDADRYDDFLIAQPNATTEKTSIDAGLKEAGRVWLIYGGRREAP